MTFRPVRASAKIRRILLAMLKSFGVAVGVGLGFYVAYKLVRRSIRAVQPTKKEEKKEKKKDEKTNEEKTQPGRCDGCSRENRDESLMRCGGAGELGSATVRARQVTGRATVRVVKQSNNFNKGSSHLSRKESTERR